MKVTYLFLRVLSLAIGLGMVAFGIYNIFAFSILAPIDIILPVYYM
jgi:hypothetical protein